MKRFILLTAIAFVCSAMLSACSGCKAGKPPKEDAAAVGGLVLERTISADREFMFARYDATGYVWLESQIVLQEAVSAETCDGAIASIVNVFQFTDENGDPQVILSTYEAGKAHSVPVPIPGFWLGDSPINDDPVKITFSKAFERLRQANTILPDSRCCVLRKPVQPGAFQHPQYIFGNSKRWVKVDAVTGDVTDGSDYE